MVNFSKYALLSASACLLLGGLTMVEAKEKKAKGAVPTAEEKFAKLDTNQDAKLSVEEFEASNPADKEKLAAAFKTADTNADGSLSADEFKTIPSSEDHGKKKKKK